MGSLTAAPTSLDQLKEQQGPAGSLDFMWRQVKRNKRKVFTQAAAETNNTGGDKGHTWEPIKVKKSEWRVTPLRQLLSSWSQLRTKLVHLNICIWLQIYIFFLFNSNNN